jgi:DNA repair protein RadD
MTAFVLRPKQERAMELLRASIRNSISSGSPVRTVMQAPTGFGKTVLAAHILAGTLANRQRAAFVVPMINLIQQSFDRFIANGIDPADMGVIQGDHPWRRPQAPLQICSVQTLHKRSFPEVRRVIVDESHLRFKPIEKWMEERPDIHFIGLSATPWSAGMGHHWNDLVIPTTLKELIEDGDLAPFRVFASSHPDLTAVRVVAGEYQQDQLSAAMSGKTIVADVVENWIAKGEGRPTLAFAVDRAHAASLHAQFSECGVSSEYVDGETPRGERQEILARFKSGETKVICSVGTMTTGVDLPNVSCLILARPTKSKILYVQMIGRGLRTEDGKADCLVFDHTDTTLNLGLATDIYQAKLRTDKSDAAERKAPTEKPAPLPRECFRCSAVIPAGVRICPACGAKSQKPSIVETIDGELHELGVAPELELAKNGQPKSAKARLAAQGKQEIYSQLLGAQKSRADGWVSHKYRAIFDVWPSGLLKVPVTPRAELQSWLHAENIKFAKSKGRLGALNMARKGDQMELANAS